MINIDDRLIKEVSPKIRPNALSVLLAIAIHLNQKTNRAFPSHHRLMSLTGMGKNAVYDALNVLKEEKLLVSEQPIDSKSKKFGRRTFRLTTRFIKIFVDAQDAEPLPESREPESREPESREPESRETYQLKEVEQINEEEQINNDDVAAGENSNLKAELSRVEELVPPGRAEIPAPAAPSFRPVDIDLEAARLLADELVKENFRRRCRIPIEQFPNYVSDFTLHVKSLQKTYSNTTEFRAHFYNWCDTHKAKAPAPRPGVSRPLPPDMIDLNAL